MKYIYLIAVVLMLASCSVTKEVYVNFTPKENDIYTRPSLNNLLKRNANLAVIVRVPNESNIISSSNTISLSSTYNSIEKELLRNNFTVRDRAIFERVSSQNQQIDYAKLHEITGVDMLIELVDVSPVDFSTNIYYDKKGNAITLPINETLKGLKAEFKIVTLKENEVAGNYTFYWTPCVNGCKYIYYKNIGVVPANVGISKNRNAPAPYQTISSSAWSDFISSATKRIINEMR